MSISVKSDITKHERTILIEGAPDLWTANRRGSWFNPTFIRINSASDGKTFLWVGGIVRKKDGELGVQDTGDSFALEARDHYRDLAPQWVLDIVNGGES